jgi:hypothetical protein
VSNILLRLVFLMFVIYLGPVSSASWASPSSLSPSSGRKKAGADSTGSWSKLSVEKRCEGLLDLFKVLSPASVPGWKLVTPQCVISGSIDQGLSWSFEGTWQKGTKALTLQYVVFETDTQKPRTQWCAVKGDKVGCAAPWEHAFAAGDLFAKKSDGEVAFQGVVKLSQGFLNMALKLDEFVSKVEGQPTIFDLPYGDWVRAWAVATRSLPVKADVFTAQYKVDGEGELSGVVFPKGDIPQELRECLGCGKTACEKSPIVFTFKGLGLTMTRRLTDEERDASKRTIGRASWVIMAPTPFVNSQSKWPFICGSHRVSVQKF